jgi:kumamolisin
MSKYRDHVPLSGSERVPVAGAKVIGAVNPEEKLEVAVILKPKASREATQKAIRALASQPLAERKHMTREQFAAERGAQPADIEKIEEFAHEYGLSVVSADAARRAVVLAGTVAAFSQAFQVNLHRYEHGRGTYRGRTGAIQIPSELSGIVSAVMGLDNRPQAKPHFRGRKLASTSHARKAQPAGTFTPVEVAALYNFPTAASGKGQCIALIELGGGYRSRDLSHYFKSVLGIAQPKVKAISVDGGTNSPTGDGNGPDGEVMLDIEVAGAVAPQSKIAVYFAPNTDQGFYDAISTAVHDTKNKPSVVSISWGGPESTWSEQSLNEYNALFEDAATLGVTVCAAAGDDGSTDGVTDGLQHADFPSSSPYVLACGGTKLTASGGTISNEVVWNETALDEGATGGGISEFFAKPDYQSSAGVPNSLNPGHFVGRGLPDVAGNADPATGYDVYVDGQAGVIGGTSAVAPLWAGLVACINELMGTAAGFLNPLLYSQLAGSRGLRDITSGNNGAFMAGTGWDACTGLGSPDGTAITGALTGRKTAKPQSRN